MGPMGTKVSSGKLQIHDMLLNNAWLTYLMKWLLVIDTES